LLVNNKHKSQSALVTDETTKIVYNFLHFVNLHMLHATAVVTIVNIPHS